MTTAKTSFARKCVNATARVCEHIVVHFVLGACAPGLLTGLGVAIIAQRFGCSENTQLVVALVVCFTVLLTFAIILGVPAAIYAGISGVVVSSLYSGFLWIKNRFTKSA